MSIRLHVIGPGREVICGFSASLSLSRSLRSSPTAYALHRVVVSVAAVSALQNHMLPPAYVGAQHQYRLRNADTPSSKRRSFSAPAAAALRPCPVLGAPTLGVAATTPLPRSATDVDALRWRPRLFPPFYSDPLPRDVAGKVVSSLVRRPHSLLCTFHLCAQLLSLTLLLIARL